jgi:hypothetical protein
MDFDSHLLKVRRNWDFLSLHDCSEDAHSDWNVTVLFYTALHLADAFLHLNGEDHRSSHGVRNQALRLIASQGFLTDQALADYLQLYSRSRALRYEEIHTDAAELISLLLQNFRNFEREAIQAMPGISPLPLLPVEVPP